jgi:hypothetical protein
MKTPQPDSESLPIAVRVYPAHAHAEKPARAQKQWKRPKAMLIFDTETRVDASQRLTFGSYRFIVDGVCLEEALFYGDDLPGGDLKVLQNYIKMHQAEAINKQLRILTRREFVDKLYRAAYKGRCLLVAFNLPFDISRVAYDFTTARGRFAGGFALELWSYIDERGRERVNPHRPRIAIKHIDSKRALKGFTARKSPDQADLIPEDSENGQPQEGYRFRGHFLDLRTLAFALTDRGYSLESACEEFGVEHPKDPAARHGIVTEEYIDYNRRDGLASYELAVKLLEEYDKHPIALQATKAYSPASIGKGYLRAMGIKPILERQPDFPKKYLGYAQSAFFGGRTSAHIRKVVTPVVYTDFLSMYPTVNRLMDLWRFVIAKEIRVIEHCEREIHEFLSSVTSDSLLKPATWKHLTAFVKVVPDSDILPSRAKYASQSNDWQVGINYLYGDERNPLWFSLPDVVASVLLTGQIPKIVDAFRIEPHGLHPGLQPLKLRGVIKIDPRSQDFFKVVIEERKRLVLRTDLSDVERARLDKALKVLANAASYGIYAEMNPQESEHKVDVTCHGIDPKPFKCRVAHPDVPGEYCFPPVASLITGAARLTLALLEHSVSELGGTYAMEDTDSMAIDATEHGGVLSCPGGAVKALSWKQVRDIADRFASLNPYDRDAVPGSILKIEDDNYDPTTKKQRQIYCFAISAKRYCLLLRDEHGVPFFLRKNVNNKENQWSEHGLGHLLNPIDPESEDREWIAQVWLRLVSKALNLPCPKLRFENIPAVGRITVSSPAVMKPLTNLNSGKAYPDRIKPFSFLLSCHLRPFGHPVGADPERFHLIGRYELDSRKWLEQEWIDLYSGKTYRISTTDHHGNRRTARVKTYGDVVTDYEFHPESKCADADGKPCGKQTVGLLQRRHIRIDLIKNIGKESNNLEMVGSGLIHSEQNLYTEYPDPRRDEWRTRIVPALKKVTLRHLQKLSGRSRRMLIKARRGHARPHRNNQETLKKIVQELGLI